MRVLVAISVYRGNDDKVKVAEQVLYGGVILTVLGDQLLGKICDCGGADPLTSVNASLNPDDFFARTGVDANLNCHNGATFGRFANIYSFGN